MTGRLHETAQPMVLEMLHSFKETISKRTWENQLEHGWGSCWSKCKFIDEVVKEVFWSHWSWLKTQGIILLQCKTGGKGGRGEGYGSSEKLGTSLDLLTSLSIQQKVVGHAVGSGRCWSSA